MKIGYQGIAGSYSSEASVKFFCDKDIKDCNIKFSENIFTIDNLNFQHFAKFEDVFKALKNGDIDRGVIPLENSYAGRVAEIHNLFPLYNLYIVGEIVLRVDHFLVAKKDTRVEDVIAIYSHEQALMQCNKSIERYFKNQVNLNSVANTAVGANIVANSGNFSDAAIASHFASNLYGLDVLVSNFADVSTNYTKFIVLSREPDFTDNIENALTSVLFTVRNIPAAIYKAIGGFATNGIDLVKLESYIPGGIGSNAAQFFVTFKGNIKEQRVRLAIEELGFFTIKTTVLGCYDSDKTI
jgi:prephenate dehydratase